MTSNDVFDIIFQLKDYRCHLKLCPTRPLSSLGHNMSQHHHIYAPSCSSQTHEGCQAHPYHPSKIESAALPKSGSNLFSFLLRFRRVRTASWPFRQVLPRGCLSQAADPVPPIESRWGDEKSKHVQQNNSCMSPSCHHHGTPKVITKASTMRPQKLGKFLQFRSLGFAPKL